MNMDEVIMDFNDYSKKKNKIFDYFRNNIDNFVSKYSLKEILNYDKEKIYKKGKKADKEELSYLRAIGQEKMMGTRVGQIYSNFHNFFENKDGLTKFKEFVTDLIQVDKTNFYNSFKKNIIDNNHFINSSPIISTLIQMVAVYFPNHFLPIYNIQMLEEKANNFGIDLDSLGPEEKLIISSKKSGAKFLLLNELLIKTKTAHKIAKNWDNIVFTHFLFMCLPLKVLEALKKLNIAIKYIDPSDEQFVVGIFLKIHEKLGYKQITKLKKSYPDAEVETFQGDLKQVEFEYNSSSFIGHNPDICDVVVCWHDDLNGKIEKDNNIKVIAFDNILNENSELYKQLFSE